MCYSTLVSFSFRQTRDHGQKTLVSGPQRSLIKELIHFLNVESPMEGTGRIGGGGGVLLARRELIRMHHPPTG